MIGAFLRTSWKNVVCSRPRDPISAIFSTAFSANPTRASKGKKLHYLSPSASLSKLIARNEYKSNLVSQTSKARYIKNTIDNNKKRFFPDTSDKTVAYWLLASAANVFGIVVFGGLTRLTESGSEFQFALTSSY